MDASLVERIAVSRQAIERQAKGLRPRVGIILGSGLSSVAERLEGSCVLPYASLPHWAPSQVSGHAGELHLGSLQGVACVVMCGRIHAYEGHSPQTVTFGVRVLQALGIEILLVTNAAGGIAAQFAVGDLMVIHDHLNLTGSNPLVGPNEAALGPRFFDMGQAYCPKARQLMHAAGRRTGLNLREGVYAGLLGPNYETPAEIRMLRTLGADAVGMSTVSEVLVARHMGLRVAGLSLITNLAAGLSPTPLSHAEVSAMGATVRTVLGDLLENLIPTLVDS
jgi:purine-nucleoside phosphorylase